jgi:hypothetical protein
VICSGIFLRPLQDKPPGQGKVAEYAGYAGYGFDSRFQERAMAGTIRDEQDDLAHNDQDSGKGAVETDGRDSGSNTSIAGQQGHRGNLTGTDSDFPEPGSGPEHSGEPSGSPVLNEDESVA